MEETITRKDGITYTRKKNEIQQDKNLNIRINSELDARLRNIASKLNIRYSDLVRDSLESYLKEYENERLSKTTSEV